MKIGFIGLGVMGIFLAVLVVGFIIALQKQKGIKDEKGS